MTKTSLITTIPIAKLPTPNALGYVDQDGADSTFPDGILPRNREFEGGDNKYQITIRATETEGDTNRALSTEEHYTVEVLNQDEDGEVELNWLQPEIGTEITGNIDRR